MIISAYFCVVLCVFVLAFNAASMGLAARKCRARPRTLPVPKNGPSVSVVRPLCGLEAFNEETLAATFTLDYPNYEILFCIQTADDPNRSACPARHRGPSRRHGPDIDRQ